MSLSSQPKIYLASGSPRRVDLLKQVGISFVQIRCEIDESPLYGEGSVDLVKRLSLAKARTGLQACEEGSVVIAADTVIDTGQLILGKPEGKQHFLEMMAALSGASHQVVTGLAVLTPSETKVIAVSSIVTMRSISEAEREEYWSTGEPKDKAGGYAIQGRGAAFVSRIDGSYSAIVGLPLAELTEMSILGWK